MILSVSIILDKQEQTHLGRIHSVTQVFHDAKAIYEFDASTLNTVVVLFLLVLHMTTPPSSGHSSPANFSLPSTSRILDSSSSHPIRAN
jgi:hypothetical protein